MLHATQEDMDEIIHEGEVRAESMHEDIPTAAWSRCLNQLFDDHKQFSV